RSCVRAPSATALHGTIDWTRRFDHMQQHTGQHVLSAAFARLLTVRTESFHMGVDSSTIDLAREASAQEIARAENEANRIVWEDRPVRIRFAAAEEAASMGLRKETKRDSTLRLIEIEDFDLSACGGTHVARTGAIGIIAVAAREAVRRGARDTLPAWARAGGFGGGWRSRSWGGGAPGAGSRGWGDGVAGRVRALSVLPAELPW